MTAVCLASFTIFAGVLSTLYGLDRYKNRKVEEEHNAKEPLDEQLA
jgi:hypothetical protein